MVKQPRFALQLWKVHLDKHGILISNSRTLYTYSEGAFLCVVKWSSMSQNFFTAAIGSHVQRGTNLIFIKDYAMAQALFKLQDENYKFSPVVHSSANVCLSCEG